MSHSSTGLVKGSNFGEGPRKEVFIYNNIMGGEPAGDRVNCDDAEP
jgi:hypothetical protein